MAKVGFQDLWVVGSRFRFKKDPVGGVEQPMLDLGSILTANPASTTESLPFFDGGSGIKRKIHETLTSIEESYEITCSNLSPDNQQFMFLSEAPEAFTQAVEHNDVEHYAHVGRLLKIRDNDVANTPLYMLSAVAGVYRLLAGTVTPIAVTTIVASTRTLTSGAAHGLIAGDLFILAGDGLANIANASTYEVATAPTATTLTILPSQSFAGGNETAITGRLIRVTAPGDAEIYEKGETGWEIDSLEMGAIKMTAKPTTDGDVVVVYSTAAVSGKRLLRPQSQKGPITGEGWIEWNMGGDAERTVRYARMSIIPSTPNLSIDDYSNFVITVSVLSTIEDDSAGVLIKIKGDLPNPA